MVSKFNKLMFIKRSALTLVLAVTISISTAPVFAVSNNANSHANTASSGSSTGSSTGNSNSQTGKQRACQNRQTAINFIIKRIETRGQNQLDLFSAIAQKVETFATNKNVTVPNYSQLLATLSSDKTKAETDLAAMKTTDKLDCSSPDPKATVDAFKADLNQEISDLKTYKTDVKNLIVAVKTAIGGSASSKTSTTGGSE